MEIRPTAFSLSACTYKWVLFHDPSPFSYNRRRCRHLLSSSLTLFVVVVVVERKVGMKE